MKALLIFLILLSSGCSHLKNPDLWSTADKVLLGTAMTFKTLDYLQTKEFNDDDNYYETNRYLGRHPSDNEIDLYFGITALGQVVVAHFLPSTLRKMWLGGWVIVSADTVIDNHSIGIRIRF